MRAGSKQIRQQLLHLPDRIDIEHPEITLHAVTSLACAAATHLAGRNEEALDVDNVGETQHGVGEHVVSCHQICHEARVVGVQRLVEIILQAARCDGSSAGGANRPDVLALAANWPREAPAAEPAQRHVVCLVRGGVDRGDETAALHIGVARRRCADIRAVD